jgi:hypothetical protein
MSKPMAEDHTTPSTKTHTLKDYGLACGLAAYILAGAIGLYLLRICWPAYAVASIDKSYTIEMLFSRLSVAVLAAILAGITAKAIAKDHGKTSWLVGVIIFFMAAYLHFFRVWDDYPAWYHFVYLLPIVPIIGLSHYFIPGKKAD